MAVFFENKRFSSFFEWKLMVQLSTVENFKTVWTYLTSQETALKFIKVIGPFAENLRNFCFQKQLWLDS